MIQKTFTPYTIIQPRWLSLCFQIVFTFLLLIILSILIATLQQTHYAVFQHAVPICTFTLLLIVRLSYRIIITSSQSIIKIPFFHKWKVQDIVGITYGSIIGFGGVTYNIMCFLHNGHHITLSINNPEAFIQELQKINPELIVINTKDVHVNR